jgi:hypothetical protein
MSPIIIVLLLGLNFAVAWWNCYAVGGSWEESKQIGGFIRFVSWSAVTQSAIGFSQVSGALIMFGLHLFGKLPLSVAAHAMQLWYLLVIIPALGTGLALTIHAWNEWWRDRSIANLAGASYNTLVQAMNMYQAIDGIGDAFKGVADLFSGDDDDAKGWVIGIVVFALLFGIVMTYALVGLYSGRLKMPRRADSRGQRVYS